MSNFKQTVQKQLKPYSKSLNELDEKPLELILKLLEYYLTHGSCPEDKIDKAVALAPHSQEYFHEAFTGLLLLCQAYIRVSISMVKRQELQEILYDAKLKPDMVDIVVERLIQLKETQGLHSSIERPIRFSAPKSIDWRINISGLSTQSEKSINQITIVLQIRQENEELHTFVLPISMFHKLRFQIASLLRNIHALEGRASMKN